VSALRATFAASPLTHLGRGTGTATARPPPRRGLRICPGCRAYRRSWDSAERRRHACRRPSDPRRLKPPEPSSLSARLSESTRWAMGRAISRCAEANSRPTELSDVPPLGDGARADGRRASARRPPEHGSWRWRRAPWNRARTRPGCGWLVDRRGRDSDPPSQPAAARGTVDAGPSPAPRAGEEWTGGTPWCCDGTRAFSTWTSCTWPAGSGREGLRPGESWVPSLCRLTAASPSPSSPPCARRSGKPRACFRWPGGLKAPRRPRGRQVRLGSKEEPSSSAIGRKSSGPRRAYPDLAAGASTRGGDGSLGRGRIQASATPSWRDGSRGPTASPSPGQMSPCPLRRPADGVGPQPGIGGTGRPETSPRRRSPRPGTVHGQLNLVTMLLARQAEADGRRVARHSDPRRLAVEQ